MTVPLTIWSVRKVMDSQPCSRAIRPPLSTAISTARVCAVSSGMSMFAPRRKKSVVKPKQAAKSIMPSMAMLTTPARSHQMPAMAPMASGVARRRLSATMVVMLVLVPAAAAMITLGMKRMPHSAINARLSRCGRGVANSAKFSAPLMTNKMPMNPR